MPLDPTVLIIFGTLFLSLVASLLYAFWYQSFKFKYKDTGSGAREDSSRSIGVSELKALIQTAVEEAIHPGKIHARRAQSILREELVT